MNRRRRTKEKTPVPSISLSPMMPARKSPELAKLHPEIQRTCADKIPGLGECPPEDLKIGDEWGGQVLNMRLFSSSFKRPRHPNDL